MSKHCITTTYDPDGADIECRIHFTYHSGFAGRFHVDPTPPEPASVEFDRLEVIHRRGRWIEWYFPNDWAAIYLQGDGLDDAMKAVAEDRIAAEEYRAEMRADR